MGLVLTRPSYQGVLLHSDILRQLIQDCHQQLIPVLVDEAHGAHLRFLPEQYQIAGNAQSLLSIFSKDERMEMFTYFTLT